MIATGNTELAKDFKTTFGKITTPKTYPTRSQMIGEVECFYLSFYKNGKYPICNIGPSRCAMCGMLTFATFCFGFLVLLSILVYSEHALWLYCTITLNLICFFYTMFADPGIDSSIYDHYLKNEFGDKLENEPDCDPEANAMVVVKDHSFKELKMNKDYRPIWRKR